MEDTDPGRIAASWWDRHGAEYLADHRLLGVTNFSWGPEGWTEDDLRLLPDDPGLTLEVGAGAAQCSRWLAARGHRVIATDISSGMLAHAARMNEETGIDVPLIRADVRTLPFADNSFDTAFTSFGAIGFLPDLCEPFAEVARVLRPGGRWIYAATHPFSWPLPDSPHLDDLRVIRPYRSGEVYTETEGSTICYAEYAHTVSDHIGAIIAAGLTITGVLEPAWPAGNDQSWGAWGPERGAYLPGTIIFSTQKPVPTV
ncbi:MAG: class I SAM-dependent methyltransferase [Flaviflexus sp.]|nr:class I SAM-dependent methyltransferase [Flaviflexus sp.]